jgi:hypothetical protein
MPTDPTVEQLEPDPAIQARVAEIMAEIAAGLRWQPVKSPSPASSAAAPSDAHIRAVLELPEQDTWNRLQPSDRVKLTREFRDDPISELGLSYLRKKIVLLAPPTPDDQVVAQPAAVGSAADDGKGA